MVGMTYGAGGQTVKSEGVPGVGGTEETMFGGGMLQYIGAATK